MSQHLIFGDDDAKLSEAARKLRSADATIEIGVRRASGFTPENPEAAHVVHLLGDYPHIAQAYEGKATIQTVTTDDPEKKPAKKGKSE